MTALGQATPSLSELRDAQALARAARERLEQGAPWAEVAGSAARIVGALALAIVERVGPALVDAAAAKIEERLRR